jgi:hypothetical protein
MRSCISAHRERVWDTFACVAVPSDGGPHRRRLISLLLPLSCQPHSPRAIYLSSTYQWATPRSSPALYCPPQPASAAPPPPLVQAQAQALPLQAPPARGPPRRAFRGRRTARARRRTRSSTSRRARPRRRSRRAVRTPFLAPSRSLAHSRVFF